MKVYDSLFLLFRRIYTIRLPRKQHMARIDKHIALRRQIHDIVNSLAVESFIGLRTIKIKFFHMAMEKN